MSKPPHILVFGGRGAIGSAVCRRFAELGWRVTATSRTAAPAGHIGVSRWVKCDPSIDRASPTNLDSDTPYSAVCWAQGANINDSVFDIDTSQHLKLYRANCVFVLETLRILLENNRLSSGARLVAVSSIWQKIARQDKLSYIMSKAALGGLIQSAAVDLGTRGILINAVLPSALDTPMTHENLTATQIGALQQGTGFGRLTSVDEVVATIEFLCSKTNTGITGQSITVDLGFSFARIV